MSDIRKTDTTDKSGQNLRNVITFILFVSLPALIPVNVLLWKLALS